MHLRPRLGAERLEPARRAWEAGVRSPSLGLPDTATLFLYDRWGEIVTALHEWGLPPSAAAGRA